MEKTWIRIGNPLVKQGNSYCVRIPIHAVKQMNAKENDILVLKVKKLIPQLSERVLDQAYKKAKKFAELKHLSKEKITLLTILSFNEGKKILEANKGKMPGKDSNPDKLLKLQKKYRHNIKKEFGEKILKEYSLFVRCFKKR